MTTTRHSSTDTCAPIISATDVSVSFRVREAGLRRARARAVDGVSLDIRPGETFGLLGESGSGKSTLGRVLLHLIRADSGEIRFGGRDLARMSSSERRAQRQRMQMVFQDPYSSFDPTVVLLDSLKEPLKVNTSFGRAAVLDRIHEVVHDVGLTARHLEQRPHQLSGGQLQRLAIARALTLSPDLLVLDEPVSALDVSTQAQILNLLLDLQNSRGLAYLLISHDPGVVRHVSHRVGVMYLGQLVEVGTAAEVFDHPRHPYTQALLSAELTGEPGQPRPPAAARGEIPSNVTPPSGCYFHPRCSKRFEPCDTERPPLHITGDSHTRCHLYGEQTTEESPA